MVAPWVARKRSCSLRAMHKPLNTQHSRTGLRSLQEATVAPQDLVELVSGKTEEALAREHDWVVRQRRVGNNKVLLRRLERFDKAVVGIVQDARGIVGVRRNERPWKVAGWKERV